MGSPTCFSMLLGYSGTRTYVFHCLPYFYLCGSLSAAPLPVFRCLYTYGCVLHSLSLSLSLFSTVSLLLLSLCSFARHIFISELHCLILPSKCYIACLLISLCSTASATAMFLCLSTNISILYCLWYSYPCVPSTLYLYLCVPLRSLFLSPSSFGSLLSISVFYCLFCSCSCVPLPLLLLSRVALCLVLVCTCFIASAIRIFVFYHVYFFYPYIPSPLLLVSVKVSVFRTRVPVSS